MTDLAAWTDPIADEEYTFMVHDNGEDLPMIWVGPMLGGGYMGYTHAKYWPPIREFHNARTQHELYGQLIATAQNASTFCAPEHRDRFTALQRCLRIARRNAERATA